MLPKNSKHYILPTAEQLDCNSQIVEDIVAFYYSTLRKALVDLKGFNVKVDNLGTFRIKEKELPQLFQKYSKHLNVLKPEPFNQTALKKDIEGKLLKVIAAQKMIKENKSRKKEFLEKKYGNARKNMES